MQRLQSIDILKLFAMFLVLWGHCVQFMLTSHYLDEPAYIYIYSFHMPLFFMISGLFVHSSLPMAADFGKQLLTRARQLLLPCLAWGVLMSLGNLVQPMINGTTSEHSLWYTLMWNFWFLKSLFVCFALWLVSILLLRKRWLALAVSLLVSQCITAWEVQWSYPAFAIGVLIGPYLSTIRLRRKPIALTTFLIGGILLLGWNKSYFLIPSVWSWSTLAADAIIMSVAMRIYRIFIGASLSLGFLALFLGLEERLQTTAVTSINAVEPKTIIRPAQLFAARLADWGKLTLGIYIIHTLFIIVRERLFPTLLCCDSLNPWLFNIVIAPLSAAVLLLVSVGLTRLITLLPQLSFFLLGTPWPKRQSA